MSREGSRRNSRQFISTTSLSIPARSKYLRTLGDDLLTRTELALRLVNQYETRRQRIEFPTGSIALATVADDNSKGIHTNLQEDTVEKINIVGEGSRELFKIDCRGKTFPLRLQFRNVRNTTRVYASFKERYPSSEARDIEFEVNKDCRHNIQPRNQKYQDFLHLCLQAMSHIGVMDVKVSFFNEHLEKIRQGYKMRNGKVYLSPIRTEQVQRQRDDSVDHESTARTILPQLATTREKPSKSHSTNHLNRMGSTADKISSEKNITNLDKSKDINKAIDAKLRRQELAQLKIKEREFIEKAAQSKEVIKAYEQRLAYEAEQRTKISLAMTKLLMLNQLFLQIDKGAKSYVEKFGIFARVALRQNRAVAKIKRYYQNAIAEIPSRKARATAHLHEAVYFLAKFKNKKAINSSQAIIQHFIEPFAVCMRLNESFDQATTFRRKLRFIQKYWKAKYHARLEVIKEFAAGQVRKTLVTYPHFQPLEELFNKLNQLNTLCVEYVKDVAEKFNQMYAAHLQMLIDIEQIKKANELIKDENTRLLKKRQKPLLKVPETPCKPFYRFFRDLDNLKASIRSWFEIEYKKMERRNRKKEPK